MSEDEGKVRLDQETPATPLTVQSRESRTEMQLRVADWQRIRRDIRELKGWSTAWFSGSTLLFGISAAAGLSLVTLYNNSNPPSHWVVATHIAITSASGFGGLICVVAGIAGWFRYRRRRGRLEIELDVIESTFPWGAAHPFRTATRLERLAAYLHFNHGMNTKSGKRRYCDAQLRHLEKLRAKFDAMTDEEWNTNNQRVTSDILHCEDAIRAELLDWFPPGTDDLFDSEEGLEPTVWGTRQSSVSYLDHRIIRLGQIRKQLV